MDYTAARCGSGKEEMLSEIRNDAGLTQEELARESGVSLRTIQYLEARGCADAKVRTLARIARVLGCTVDALMRGCDRR